MVNLIGLLYHNRSKTLHTHKLQSTLRDSIRLTSSTAGVDSRTWIPDGNYPPLLPYVSANSFLFNESFSSASRAQKWDERENSGLGCSLAPQSNFKGLSGCGMNVDVGIKLSFSVLPDRQHNPQVASWIYTQHTTVTSAAVRIRSWFLNSVQIII